MVAGVEECFAETAFLVAAAGVGEHLFAALVGGGVVEAFAGEVFAAHAPTVFGVAVAAVVELFGHASGSGSTDVVGDEVELEGGAVIVDVVVDG